MFRVYWTHTRLRYNEDDDDWQELCGETLDIKSTYSTSHFRDFDQSELNECIAFMEMLRADRKAGAGYSFIGMVSENPNQVGDAGVSSVENGVCPDGVEYTWKKRRA